VGLNSQYINKNCYTLIYVLLIIRKLSSENSACIANPSETAGKRINKSSELNSS